MASASRTTDAAAPPTVREGADAANYQLDALLTRREAAAFLRGQGFPVAEATLATKATRGGGPAYSLFSGRALPRGGPGRLGKGGLDAGPPQHIRSRHLNDATPRRRCRRGCGTGFDVW